MDGHRQQDNISIIHTFLHQVYTFILHSWRRRDFSTTRILATREESLCCVLHEKFMYALKSTKPREDQQVVYSHFQHNISVCSKEKLVQREDCRLTKAICNIHFFIEFLPTTVQYCHKGLKKIKNNALLVFGMFWCAVPINHQYSAWLKNFAFVLHLSSQVLLYNEVHILWMLVYMAVGV